MSLNKDMMHPELRKREAKFAEKMNEAKLPYVITNIARTILVQMALYVQGRLGIDDVNIFRYTAGLKKITAIDNKIVTWTLNSAHVTNMFDKKLNNDYSRAFDIALYKYDRVHFNTKLSVNENEIPDYIEAGQIAEEVGLESGARFGDFCHIQLPKEVL